MKRYDIKMASYHKLLDILYVGYGDSSLDSCTSIEDTPSGITVMYDKNGVFSGAEIPCFSENYGSLPATIDIDSSKPFTLSVEDAKSFPSKC